MASVILKIDVFNLSFQSGVGVSALREDERRSSQTLPTCRSNARISRGRTLSPQVREGVRLKRTDDVRSVQIVRIATFLRQFGGLYYTCAARDE